MGQMSFKKRVAVLIVVFLAHATMEPMNCTADVKADSVDVYAPTQGQTACHMAAIAASGLPMNKVKIHTTYLGGGFGICSMKAMARHRVAMPGELQLIEKEINGGNPAVPGDDEISPGVGWRIARPARYPRDPSAIANLLGLGN